MLISSAFAQPATGTGGGVGIGDVIAQFGIFIPIIAIFYFIVIRPQQQRAKAHQQLVANVRRGDTVVTSGGIVGKIVKVLENDEVLVEIAEDVRIRVIKSTLADVRSKTEPSEAKSKADADDDKK
jgi:preprotein translocase subunit YajC